jgi:ribosomal protein S4E
MGRGGETCTGIWRENLRESHHLVDTGVDGRIILKRIFRKWDVGGMDWIELVQDRDRWRVLGNAVMNLRVP